MTPNPLKASIERVKILVPNLPENRDKFKNSLVFIYPNEGSLVTYGDIHSVIQAAESTLALQSALDVAEKALQRISEYSNEPEAIMARDALTQISALRGKGG